MRRNEPMISGFVIAVLFFGSTASWSATLVDTIGSGSTWNQQTENNDGTASIVGPSVAPSGLPGFDTNGAARLTTIDGAPDDLYALNSQAEIGRNADFGKVLDIFDSGLSFEYSYFKVESGNETAAPALKLLFCNPCGVDPVLMQLVYEPTWNLPPQDPPVSVNPTPGEWVTATVNFDSGLFWSGGGFGFPPQGGGPPGYTLAGWLQYAVDNGLTLFESSTLSQVLIGVGTYNLGQIGYFDAVSIEGTLSDGVFDFGVVPLPAAAPLLIGSFALLGLLGWRQRNGHMKRPSMVLPANRSA